MLALKFLDGGSFEGVLVYFFVFLAGVWSATGLGCRVVLLPLTGSAAGLAGETFFLTSAFDLSLLGFAFEGLDLEVFLG